MTTARPRLRRTVAAVALFVLAALLHLGTGLPASGQEIDCLLEPDAPECATTSSVEDTTTSTPDVEAPPVVEDEETPTSDAGAGTSGGGVVSTDGSTDAGADDEPDDDVDPADATATSDTLSVATSSDLLVAGDGTEGAQSTTTSTTVAATTVDDGGTSDATLIALVIGGLVAVALLVAFLTWRYWVATRPPRAPQRTS